MNDDTTYDQDRDLDDPDLGDRGAEAQGHGAMDELQGEAQQDKGSFEQGAVRIESDVDDTLDR